MACSTSQGASRGLAGLRIFVAEDELFIAMDLADSLRALHAEVIGPAATLAEARALLASDRPDVAVLDVKLGAESVYPLVEALRRQRVSVLFASGYGRDAVPAEYRDLPFLSKPFGIDEFVRALGVALASANRARVRLVPIDCGQDGDDRTDPA